MVFQFPQVWELGMSHFQPLKDALLNVINGYVYDSNDVDFHKTNHIENGGFSLKSQLIVVPHIEEDGGNKEARENQINKLIADVSATVRLCADHGVKLVVKSNGFNSTESFRNVEGVVLDLRNLSWNSFDQKTEILTAGTGQTFHSVYSYLESIRSGYIPIGGGGSAVSLTEFLCGGGYSFVSRSYGMGCDNILALTVVCADGSMKRVHSKSKNTLDRELFWGLKGGGGGNFCVVVQVELKCYKPNSETMLFANILFPFYRFKEILSFYNFWIKTVPNELAVYGYIGPQPDPNKAEDKVLMARFTVVYNGDFANGIRLIQPLLDQNPVKTELYNMTLPEWEELIGYRTSILGRKAYIRSVTIQQNMMTPEVADIFMKYMIRRPSKHSFIDWTHAGGKVAEAHSDETAYPHRDVLFVPEVKAIWSKDDPESFRQNVEWAYEFYEELSEYANGAYVNRIDPLLRDWQDRYYGKNYKRLCDLKAQIDPNGFFDFRQGIGSKYSPAFTKRLNLSPLQSATNA